MHQDIKEIFVTEQEIIEITRRLGKEISADYENKQPILVGLLNGCVPFYAELIKNISIMMEFDFMDVKSYEGTQSVGEVKIKKDLSHDVKNRHIIIIDDIIDTGKTLALIVQLLIDRGAASVEVATLLNKPAGRTNESVNPKYIGHEIENQFVVGFGLDYNGYYRNLPYIGILKESVYKK